MTTKPVVVLVNGGSASASEILSGALQDHKRAVLVGTTTFGKGLVQSVHELSDHSGLAVTIAHYKTPAGRDIHHKGIKPDYVVEIPREVLKTLTAKDVATAKDPQYAKGVQVLLEKLNTIVATGN
jgi:carboxyl-terminal processing protease